MGVRRTDERHRPASEPSHALDDVPDDLAEAAASGVVLFRAESAPRPSPQPFSN